MDGGELIKQKLISTRLRSCWPIKMRMARHLLYSGVHVNLLQFFKRKYSKGML